MVSTVGGEGTVLAVLPRLVLAFAASNGVDMADLVREAKLSAMTWDDEDERVPRSHVDALFDLAAERTGDRAFGIRLAAALPPGNAGVVEYAAQSAATVGESLAIVMRYWGLLNDAVRFALTIRADEAAFSMTSKSGPPLARAWLEMTAVGAVTIGRRLTRQAHDPREIRMPWPRLPGADPLEEALGVCVVYDAPAFEFVYPASWLSEPLIGANAPVHGVLRGHAEQALEKMMAEGDPSFIARVREAVIARLERGDATLDRIALALGTSPRSLQRAMRKQGSSLREVVDGARRAIAERELASGTKSITDLAFVLGFSETSAFDRAFRRWTGLAPIEFRMRSRRGQLAR